MSEGPDEGLREQVQALRDGIYEGTIPGSNLREIALALDAALSAPRPSGLSEDDERDVQTALRCVDADNAGHWPTVAGVLAAEVRRLRPLLTAERDRADRLAQVIEQAESPESIERAAREAFWTDDMGGHVKGRWTWETIPEVGRENFRALVRAVIRTALSRTATEGHAPRTS